MSFSYMGFHLSLNNLTPRRSKINSWLIFNLEQTEKDAELQTPVEIIEI